MARIPAPRKAELSAEVTQFGEVLAAYDLVPGSGNDDETLSDFASALDAYEHAKRLLDTVGFTGSEELAVLQVLEEGRRALDRVDARRRGELVPTTPAPCFFDSRHGPAVTQVAWVPPGGVARPVPVCAADAVRLQDGQAPIATGGAPSNQPTSMRSGGWRGRIGWRRRSTSDDRADADHAVRSAATLAEPEAGSRSGADPISQPTPSLRGRADGIPRPMRSSRSGVERLQSPGPEEFSVRGEPGVPAVLVLRAVSRNERLSTTLQRRPRAGASGRLGELILKGSGDFTARLPMPAFGARETSIWFRIANSAVAGAPFDGSRFDVDRIPYWEVWSESIDDCREFTTSISGDAWDVVRYAGGRATARFSHDGRRGEVVVSQLDAQLRPVRQLFRGYRSVTEGEVTMPAKAAWLAVHCRGPWRLRLASGAPSRASGASRPT